MSPNYMLKLASGSSGSLAGALAHHMDIPEVEALCGIEMLINLARLGALVAEHAVSVGPTHVD